MSAEDNSWRSPPFRQNVVQKIEEAVRSSGMTPSRNSLEMENHVYQKAKTKEEYLGFVARLILHVREIGSSNQPSGGVPGVNGGALGPPGPGPAQVTATNLLQSLNQRPGLQPKLPVQGMNQMGGPMGVPVSNQMGMPLGGSQINTSTGAPIGPNSNMPPMMSSVGGPVNQLPGQLGNQMPNQMGSAPMPPQMGPIVPNQMGHLQRKNQESLIGGQPSVYAAPRPVAPNQFLRRSPTSPTQQSPVGLPNSSQMPSSPALAPSPNPQISQSMRPLGIASSPSNSTLNTPGQIQATPCPCNSQEDQAYRDKVKQLSKYIEPLRKMIAKLGADDEKLAKMKVLLELLSNQSKRVTLETLLKCEIALEKLDLKRGDGSTGPSVTRELHPLIECISNHCQTSYINHSLQRSFAISYEAFYGENMKGLPSSLKRKKEEDPSNEVPDVIQGEIARLDGRFKVSLLKTQDVKFDPRGLHLLCSLDDQKLANIPPIQISVPDGYPQSAPVCHISPQMYGTTPFLRSVLEAMQSRIHLLPCTYSISELLNMWEMSVREASEPQSLMSASSMFILDM
nr:PREDICTED: mediator of RNA polymerase II transcription subunit 15-like isoform X2 [Bemisia tabaci]XP_018911334.1 PREDICTED: mediator of RNA polymerase II transcription subunit 15-like isoform X2 [Bemisia tabaci]XP_018911335.1 PREDICTED: mediator of RNA polymerase II transcription subunit 15-like isoform X2 [Bemisia tabaci]